MTRLTCHIAHTSTRVLLGRSHRQSYQLYHTLHSRVWYRSNILASYHRISEGKIKFFNKTKMCSIPYLYQYPWFMYDINTRALGNFCTVPNIVLLYFKGCVTMSGDQIYTVMCQGMWAYVAKITVLIGPRPLILLFLELHSFITKQSE